MIEKSWVTSAAIIAALVNMASYSASAGPTENIAETDLNGDGAIDRGEYHRRMTDRFYLLDKDRNGTLSLSEVEAAGSGAFGAADSNGDRALSLREYLNSRFLDFDAADTDGDGVVSSDEARIWSAG